FGFGGLLGTPVSSASRIILRLLNGIPPQYLVSYLAAYHPHDGSRALGWVIPAFSPHSSKAISRIAFGEVVVIVAILGSPVGGGRSSMGSGMSSGLPSMTMVARVMG